MVMKNGGLGGEADLFLTIYDLQGGRLQCVKAVRPPLGLGSGQTDAFREHGKHKARR